MNTFEAVITIVVGILTVSIVGFAAYKLYENARAVRELDKRWNELCAEYDDMWRDWAERNRSE